MPICRTMTRALVALVVLAACSTAATTTEPAPEETTTTATPETTAESAPAASGAEIVLTSGELGEYLSDGDGNTLYLFLPDDASGESTCYDTCEANWPPLGEAVAGDGIDAALLGTTTPRRRERPGDVRRLAPLLLRRRRRSRGRERAGRQ